MGIIKITIKASVTNAQIIVNIVYIGFHVHRVLKVSLDRTAARLVYIACQVGAH